MRRPARFSTRGAFSRPYGPRIRALATFPRSPRPYPPLPQAVFTNSLRKLEEGGRFFLTPAPLRSRFSPACSNVRPHYLVCRVGRMFSPRASRTRTGRALEYSRPRPCPAAYGLSHVPLTKAGHVSRRVAAPCTREGTHVPSALCELPRLAHFASYCFGHSLSYSLGSLPLAGTLPCTLLRTRHSSRSTGELLARLNLDGSLGTGSGGKARNLRAGSPLRRATPNPRRLGRAFGLAPPGAPIFGRVLIDFSTSPQRGR